MRRALAVTTAIAVAAFFGAVHCRDEGEEQQSAEIRIERALAEKKMRVDWRPWSKRIGGTASVRFGTIQGEAFNEIFIGRSGAAVIGMGLRGACGETCLALDQDRNGDLHLAPHRFGPAFGDGSPTLAVAKSFRAMTEKERSFRLCETEDGSVITALVFYTRAAEEKIGDVDRMRALIAANEEATTRAFARSSVPVTFKVLDVQPLAFTERGGDLEQDLDAFRTSTVATNARDAIGADVAFLVVAVDGRCGRAHLLRSNPTTLQDSAFAVVNLECLFCDWSFTHELGHVLGACHERGEPEDGCPEHDQDPDYGFIEPSDKWGTLMATAQEGIPRLLQFSSPDARCNGDKLGTRENDNASWLRRSAPIVARFRCTR